MVVSKIFFTVILSFVFVFCNGQKLDTNYVKKFNNKFVLGVYQNYNNHSFFISQDFQKDSLYNTNLHAMAESLINTGILFSNGKLYLALNLFGFLSNAPSRKPEPRSLNFAFGLRNNGNLTEFGLNWFRGYYENNSSNFIPNFDKDSSFYSYNGLRSLQLFANHIHIYNKSRFSMNAAYKGGDIQKKSAYSFLHFFHVNYNNLISPDAIIPQAFRGSYERFGEMDKLNNFYLGAGIGGSGTWLITKDFFSNLTLMMGPGLQFQNYSITTDKVIRSRVNIMLHTDLRFSLGLNLGRFYIVSGNYFKVKTYNMREMKINSLHIMSNLTLGCRFGTKKTVKKYNNRRKFGILG